MQVTELAACRSDELHDNQMRMAELGSHKILLARVAGRCHAVSAVCPHAGGPLKQGVLHAGKVICPWHKAAFDLETGKRIEPPAVDGLQRFAAREENGQVLVDLASARADIAPSAPVVRADQRCLAIIGTGAAGMAAAQALREEGFGGRVVMIGREDVLPYDRTLLSKYVLSGKQGGEKSPLQDEAFFIRHRIERIVREVTGLDHPARRLTFSDGTTLDYDGALIATGGTPRPLKVPGADRDGVFVLRGPRDAAAISLCDSPTADALQEMIDLDLAAIAAVQPPLGYGRD